jgi:hypothetical protein
MRKSFRTAVLTAVASAVVLGASSSAMAAGPTGEFVPFKYCPYQNAAVQTCVKSVTTSGSFKLGTATVPITAATPITLQGGLSANPTTGATTFYNAANGGVTLSSTPLNVPGGLLGLINPGGFFGLLEQAFENAISSANGVTATAELVGPVGFDFLAFVTANGPAVTLPIRVHLENPFLGPSCYVGSASNPITLKLTSGTTTPPAGVAPITGSLGTFQASPSGQVSNAIGNKLVDNAFSVPAASNCGFLLLDKLLITAAVNLKEGFPSAAGKNVAILQGDTSLTAAQAVRDSVQ